MYVIIAPLQIKEGYRQQVIDEMIADARGSIENEPGCLRFDVIADATDPNRIWLYEIYKDEPAFTAHTKMPHFIKWRDTTKDWLAQAPLEPVIGGTKIWSADET